MSFFFLALVGFLGPALGQHPSTHSGTYSKGHGEPLKGQSDEKKMDTSHKGMKHGSIPYPPVPWLNPKIAISPPPPLMGKKMGQVHTLNVPPLGYAMDGNVKVYHLIAQPVKGF